jgi:hypothetical protein
LGLISRRVFGRQTGSGGEIATVTTLGLSGDGRSKIDAQVGFRSGLLRHIGVAIGGAGGAAVALGAYEVLKSAPTQSFALLQAWGPTFLIAIFCVFVAGKFLENVNSTVRESVTVMAGELRASGEAAGRTADALSRLADQGGKQFEEVRRLSLYAAQEFPSVYERFDRQDAVLHDLASSVKGLHSKLSSEKAALEKKDEAERDGN